MKNSVVIVAAVAALAFPPPTLAANLDVRVEAAWARASVGANGAAYARLVNHGKSADRLIAVKSKVAKRVQLHTHLIEGNVMRMRHVTGGIVVPPGKTVTMKPGGYHIMLMGLKAKLKTGQHFSLTFVFEKAGEVKSTVKIGKIGAMGPAMHQSQGKTKH